MSSEAPSAALDAVLVKSEAMPEFSEKVDGYDFNRGVNFEEILNSYSKCGFQATNFSLAVKQINEMVCIRGIVKLNNTSL